MRYYPFVRYWIIPFPASTAAVGFLLGDGWVWLGFATYFVLLVGDMLLPRDTRNRDFSGVPEWLRDAPLYLHSLAITAVYASFLYWMATGFSLQAPNAWLYLIGAVLSIGWVSGVPNLPVSHELMHRRHWFPRWVSRWLATLYMDPTRDVGHITGHHIDVATLKDSDTPVRGQTMYGFALQAHLASWRAAFRRGAESMRRRGKSPWNIGNVAYVTVSMPLILITICYMAGGVPAALISIIAMAIGKFFVEAFNYFQHYGIVRAVGGEIAPRHSWNHLGAVVRALGCDITNHSHHHLDSYARYDTLKVDLKKNPQMPSLFICFISGLIPRAWEHFIARPKLEDWDRKYASAEERVLAMEANRRAGWPEWLRVDDEGWSQESSATLS